MAEKILAILRVKQLYIAEPVESSDAVATASWKKLPATLRDDKLPLKMDDPDEQEIFSNESDTPIHTETIGKPYYMTGSFVEISEEAMIEVLGFEKTSIGLEHSGDVHKFEKAIKIETYSGKNYVLPRVDGSVRPEWDFGTGEVSKAPFKLVAKKASPTWKKAIIHLAESTVV